MDLPAQGWFNDARIWEEMVRLHPVDSAMLNRERPFTPDIAAILDEDSMCHLPGGSAALATELVYDALRAPGRWRVRASICSMTPLLQGSGPNCRSFFRPGAFLP